MSAPTSHYMRTGPAGSFESIYDQEGNILPGQKSQVRELRELIGKLPHPLRVLVLGSKECTPPFKVLRSSKLFIWHWEMREHLKLRVKIPSDGYAPMMSLYQPHLAHRPNNLAYLVGRSIRSLDGEVICDVHKDIFLRNSVGDDEYMETIHCENLSDSEIMEAFIDRASTFCTQMLLQLRSLGDSDY